MLIIKNIIFGSLFTEEERKTMWKSGTFDLNDINETLIDEIVFLILVIQEGDSRGSDIYH